MEEPLTAEQYIEQAISLHDRVSVEEWERADRALWASYELLGIPKDRRMIKSELKMCRIVALRILEAFPEGLPETVEEIEAKYRDAASPPA